MEQPMPDQSEASTEATQQALVPVADAAVAAVLGPAPILATGDAGVLERAVAALAAGEVVAFATDSTYVLGALFSSTVGIARVLAMKESAGGQALPVLIGDLDSLARVAAPGVTGVDRLIGRFWPGPLTLILPRHSSVPPELTLGRGNVSVRMPDHPDALLLLRALGAPIASGSANKLGAPPPAGAREMAAIFPELAAVLEGAAPGNVAPTVLDLTRAGRPLLLRQGAVPREALEETLGRYLG